MAEKEEQVVKGPNPGDPSGTSVPVGPDPAAPTIDQSLVAQVRQFQNEPGVSVLSAMATVSPVALQAEAAVEETFRAGANLSEDAGKHFEEEVPTGEDRVETRTDAAQEEPESPPEEEPEKAEPKKAEPKKAEPKPPEPKK